MSKGVCIYKQMQTIEDKSEACLRVRIVACFYD